MENKRKQHEEHFNKVLENLGYELNERVVGYKYSLVGFHDYETPFGKYNVFKITLGQKVANDGKITCQVCGGRLHWKDAYYQVEFAIKEDIAADEEWLEEYGITSGHKDCLISIQR